jgi:hypothetical protein
MIIFVFKCCSGLLSLTVSFAGLNYISVCVFYVKMWFKRKLDE